MSLTYKEFSRVYDTPGTELTEEQLQEIFGMFGSPEKVAAAKAVKAKQEFELRKTKRDQDQNTYAAKKAADDAEKKKLGPNARTVSLTAKKLDNTPFDKMKAGQLRALDRDPYGDYA